MRNNETRKGRKYSLFQRDSGAHVGSLEPGEPKMEPLFGLSEKPSEGPETTNLSTELRSGRPEEPVQPPPRQPPPSQAKEQTVVQLKQPLLEPPSLKPLLSCMKRSKTRRDLYVKRRRGVASATIGNSQLNLQVKEPELPALKCSCDARMARPLMRRRLMLRKMRVLRYLSQFGIGSFSKRRYEILREEGLSLFLNAVEMYKEHELNFSSSDICVLYTGTEGALEGALVRSKLGFSYYQRTENCPHCWIIMDRYMCITSSGLSVSKIFDLAFEAAIKDEDVDESLCRMTLHTTALSKCDVGEYTCYGDFIKSSTDYYDCEKSIVGSSELKRLFPFVLDKPISLGMILRLFKIGISLESPFVESRKIKTPFSFKDGFMHIGKEGKLSESAMEVIFDLKDEVLVGTNVMMNTPADCVLVENKNVTRNQPAEVLLETSSLRQGEELKEDSETLQSSLPTSTVGSEVVSEACQYIQSLGLAKVHTSSNILSGYKEIKARLAEMGVPWSIAAAILLKKYTVQDGPVLSSTCDILARQVAEYIRSYKSSYNRPIALGAEKRGGLSRFSANKWFYFLNRSRRGALSRFRKNNSFVGNLELNAGLIKVGLSAQEREQSGLDIRGTPKLSQYVAAIANVDLMCQIEHLDDYHRTRIWVDPGNSPEFQAACLIALWTMDPSVLFVGDFPSIEDAEFRTAKGLPKAGKCILDIPVSQFIYTLDDLKITSLQPMPKKFLVYGEYNITRGNVYVGRAKRIINAASPSSSIDEFFSD